MTRHTWDEFLAFLYELPSQINPGRQRIRVVRDNLQELVDEHVRPGLSPYDESILFPLGFSPTESDLKISAGIGLERGLITPDEYERALRADKAAGPFGFLQTLSGKTFGETISPIIAEYWLCDAGDQLVKMKNTALYDFGWTPNETGRLIRVELKASSEASPRFQQIRHPRMTDRAARNTEYDVLLCLGVANDGLEWWAFPSNAVAQFIEDDSFKPQHGGQKTESGTYWVTMKGYERNLFMNYQTSSERVREFLMNLS